MKFAWVFIAAAVVVGCSGGSGGDSNTSSNAQAPGAPSANAPDSAPPSAGAPKMSAQGMSPAPKTADTMAKTALGNASLNAARDAAIARRATFPAVEALFSTNCVKCHSGPSPKFKLDLSSYDGVMKGGAKGPVIVAGDVDASLLDKALHGKGAKQMPPMGALPEGNLKTIEAWIKAGAKNS